MFVVSTMEYLEKDDAARSIERPRMHSKRLRPKINVSGVENASNIQETKRDPQPSELKKVDNSPASGQKYDACKMPHPPKMDKNAKEHELWVMQVLIEKWLGEGVWGKVEPIINAAGRVLGWKREDDDRSRRRNNPGNTENPNYPWAHKYFTFYNIIEKRGYYALPTVKVISDVTNHMFIYSLSDHDLYSKYFSLLLPGMRDDSLDDELGIDGVFLTKNTVAEKHLLGLLHPMHNDKKTKDSKGLGGTQKHTFQYKKVSERSAFDKQYDRQLKELLINKIKEMCETLNLTFSDNGEGDSKNHSLRHAFYNTLITVMKDSKVPYDKIRNSDAAFDSARQHFGGTVGINLEWNNFTLMRLLGDLFFLEITNKNDKIPVHHDTLASFAAHWDFFMKLFGLRKKVFDSLKPKTKESLQEWHFNPQCGKGLFFEQCFKCHDYTHLPEKCYEFYKKVLHEFPKLPIVDLVMEIVDQRDSSFLTTFLGFSKQLYSLGLIINDFSINYDNFSLTTVFSKNTPEIEKNEEQMNKVFERAPPLESHFHKILLGRCVTILWENLRSIDLGKLLPGDQYNVCLGRCSTKQITHLLIYLNSWRMHHHEQLFKFLNILLEKASNSIGQIISEIVENCGDIVYLRCKYIGEKNIDAHCRVNLRLLWGVIGDSMVDIFDELHNNNLNNALDKIQEICTEVLNNTKIVEILNNLLKNKKSGVAGWFCRDNWENAFGNVMKNVGAARTFLEPFIDEYINILKATINSLDKEGKDFVRDVAALVVISLLKNHKKAFPFSKVIDKQINERSYLHDGNSEINSKIIAIYLLRVLKESIGIGIEHLDFTHDAFQRLSFWYTDSMHLQDYVDELYLVEKIRTLNTNFDNKSLPSCKYSNLLSINDIKNARERANKQISLFLQLFDVPLGLLTPLGAFLISYKFKCLRKIESAVKKIKEYKCIVKKVDVVIDVLETILSILNTNTAIKINPHTVNDPKNTKKSADIFFALLAIEQPKINKKKKKEIDKVLSDNNIKISSAPKYSKKNKMPISCCYFKFLCKSLLDNLNTLKSMLVPKEHQHELESNLKFLIVFFSAQDIWETVEELPHKYPDKESREKYTQTIYQQRSNAYAQECINTLENCRVFGEVAKGIDLGKKDTSSESQRKIFGCSLILVITITVLQLYGVTSSTVRINKNNQKLIKHGVGFSLASPRKSHNMA